MALFSLKYELFQNKNFKRFHSKQSGNVKKLAWFIFVKPNDLVEKTTKTSFAKKKCSTFLIEEKKMHMFIYSESVFVFLSLRSLNYTRLVFFNV